MSNELAVVLLLLAAAIAMFAINKPRMDAVALIMLTVLPLTGSITMGEALAGFSECSGLEMSMQPEEYKEGGNNAAVLKFPSRVTWGNLTLRRGLGTSTDLWDWHYGFVEGHGKRRDGVIVLLDEARRPARMWCFRRGLPVKYSGLQFNATQNAVAIEAIEIAHEGIFQLPGAGGGAI